MLVRALLGWVLFALASGPVVAASQTRTSAFEYDSATGLLTKEIIEPDTPALCLATTYTYDGYGNRISATTANCSGASGDAVFSSRSSSTSFSATSANPVAGQFPTASTNALSQSESKEFDAKLGALTKLTGPNGLTTTWTYDAFGRKTSESRADGTSTSWTYTACGTCPTGGVYYITEASTGAPTKNVYYDALNRELRSEVQGFDGTYVRKDTQYDSLGRVGQVSKPYLAGASVIWTVYTYDALGRAIQVDEPASSGSGTGARSVTAYNGLTVTVTVSNAGSGSGLPGGTTQTRSSTKNSQGQVVTITDAQSNTVTYAYDPFGNLTSTNAGGVSTTLSYDLRGRKTSMADPDMGSWSYAYNALGELIRQVDAKSQTSTIAYDLLGRMTTRTEPDLVSTWTYDSCTKGVGKLCSVSADNGYARSHSYDSLGRPSTVSITVASAYATTTTYDSSGKVDTLTYPSGFAVKHLYNGTGYLYKVQSTDTTPVVFWEATAQNAAGQVTAETLGNGLTASRTYDALFRLTAASATNGSATPHSQTFTYDPLGNLTARTDVTQSVTESFAFDSLNRLTQVSGSGLTTRSFEYNAIGNVTYKSDVGSYTYPGSSSARPHAVASVSGSGAANTITASYTYDANGSLTAASGTLYPATGSVSFSRTLTYTSFNLPSALSHTQGSATYSYTYTYSAEHERVRLVTVRPSDTLTSIYIHPAGKGALLYEQETRASDGLVEHKHYVNGGAGLIGIYLTKSSYGSGEGPEMRYYHKDHLGSIAVITNPAGAVLERLAYEAFGERRYPSGAPEDRASPLIGISTDRGYTTHEHLDEMMLIHMNGRIYDPLLGRFMTADPQVQFAGDLQSYNRYSYVHNNPLAYTDPSGYGIVKKIGKGIGKVVSSKVFKIAAVVAISVYAPQILASNFAWAGVAYGASMEAAAGIYLTTAGSIASGAVSGFASSMIMSGGDFEAGLRGAISGGAFGLAGTIGDAMSAERLLAHAAAGCAQGALMGGSCGTGAASAVAGKAITGLTGGNPIAAIVAGGTASVIGGGKFANGAVTASFGYLFNELGSIMREEARVTRSAWRGFHQYSFDEVICGPSERGCSYDSVGRANLQNPAPNVSLAAPVESGQTSAVAGLGQFGAVWHSVSGYHLTNTTVPGHIFDPGYVVRYPILAVDGSVIMRTVGMGWGKAPSFNEYIGERAFRGVNATVRCAVTGSGC